MMTDALRDPLSLVRSSMDGLHPSARRSLVFVGLILAALFIVGTTGCSGEAGNGSPSTADTTGTTDAAGTTDATDETPEDVEDKPPAPVVESLEATSTTVRPGASIELAVTAGRGDTDLEQSRQSLHADTGPHDGGRRDASPDEGVTTPDDGGIDGDEDEMAETMDAGETSRDASRSSDAGESAPEPPTGEVPDGWEVAWSVEGESWTIQGEGETATLTAPDTYRAETVVEVTVTDPQGREASATLRVETGLNDTPNIQRLSVEPNPVEPAGTFEVSVDATDPRGDELSYRWSAPEGWTIDEATARETTVAAPDEAGASAELRIEVRDGYGQSNRSRRLLRTRANTPPRLQSITASPPQTEPGGTVTLEATANDAEQDDLTYRWSLPSDWTADSTSGAQIQVTAPDQYGVAATAEVTVEDGRGETDTGRVLLSTVANDGPTIDSLEAQPQVVDRGGTVQLTVQASDPEGGSLDYTWSVADSSSWSLTDNGNQAELTAPDAPNESTQVTVTVRDDGGAAARASTVVSTKPNRRPTRADLAATPETVDPGGQITVEATASDPDGDSLSYDWTAPSNWSATENGDQLTLTAPDQTGLRGLVQLVVTDGQGGRAVGSVLVETEPNRPPTITSLQAASNPVLQNASTTVEVDASDPEGGSLSYRWTPGNSRWSISGSGAEVTVEAPNRANGAARVTVFVQDDRGRLTSEQLELTTQGCPTDRGNCDGDVSNACEVDLATSNQHCGACGNVCRDTEWCARGTCQGPSDAITAGVSHTCAIRRSGSEQCWGANRSGQLGDGSTSERRTPVAVQGIDSAIGMAAAGGDFESGHTCAVLPNGEVRCWGANLSGQLGDGSTSEQRTPAAVQSIDSAVEVAAAGGEIESGHTCAVLQNGEVRCWGANRTGQLGDGSNAGRTTPAAVQGIDSAVEVAAASEEPESGYTCVVLQNGEVRCWGANRSGQLGDGSTSKRTTPAAVQGIDSAVEVAAAGGGQESGHTCAVLQNGEVRCWGANRSGQLGDGSTSERTTPVAVQAIDSAIDIAAAGRGAESGHTCAVLQSGEVRCWGANRSGQLGDGSTSPEQTTPVAVQGIDSAISIATGSNPIGGYTCAMLRSGEVRCWGANRFGQLGDGSTSNRSTTPVTVKF